MIYKIGIFLINLFFINCVTFQSGIVPTGVISPTTGTSGFSASSYSIKDKIGESCVTSVFGLFAIGNASVERAASNGGITKISSVDHESRINFILNSEVCTIVRGQ